jgi:DNA-directed RNA polymerase specialized sigma24 family protein
MSNGLGGAIADLTVPSLTGPRRHQPPCVTDWDRSREEHAVTDSDPRSDAQLLALTPRDPDAFAAFYRRHVRAVLGFVARRAAPADVGDLVAEVFATALVSCRRYDPSRGAAGAWLIGIATHKLADANRRGEVEGRMCRRLGMARPVLSADDLEAELGLDLGLDLGLGVGGEELLAGLPDDQRRAVEARVLQDKGYEQIAVEQSVSAQAIRKRVSRGLGALRSRLKEEQ